MFPVWMELICDACGKPGCSGYASSDYLIGTEMRRRARENKWILDGKNTWCSAACKQAKAPTSAEGETR